RSRTSTSSTCSLATASRSPLTPALAGADCVIRLGGTGRRLRRLPRQEWRSSGGEARFNGALGGLAGELEVADIPVFEVGVGQLAAAGEGRRDQAERKLHQAEQGAGN